MYKNILLCLSILLIGCSAFGATDENVNLIKGFQNLESIQKLNVLNRLSAIADNDNVIFNKLWPSEYFQNKNDLSYIYFTQNDSDNSLDIIKFEYKQDDGPCYTKDKEDFCIPKIVPVMERYKFGQRLLAENTPDYIESPNQKEILEVLLKDNKYFDTMKVKPIKVSKQSEVYKNCDFDHEFLKSCQTFSQDSDSLLYSEEVVMKENLDGTEANPLSKALKYVKYDSEGRKIEEYYYSSGKHIFYDEKGDLKALEQYNSSTFKYANSSVPEVYIDVQFKKDDQGRLIEEDHYDSNNRLLRTYSAFYDGERISRISVEDSFNNAEWEILPINLSSLKESLFAIRF